MSTINESDYIQDGLIFELDAEDYNGGNTILAKIPNIEGTCINRTKQNGGIYASTYKNTIIKIPNTLGNITIDNCTIECCVKKTATGNYMNLIISVGNKPALTPLFGIHSDGAIRLNTANDYTGYIRNIKGPYYSENNSYRISCNYNTAIINEVEKTITRASYESGQSGANDGYIWIGNGWPTDSKGYGFIGYIFNIRLYNRKLTLNEMLYNQSIDLLKYGSYL